MNKSQALLSPCDPSSTKCVRLQLQLWQIIAADGFHYRGCVWHGDCQHDVH